MNAGPGEKPLAPTHSVKPVLSAAGLRATEAALLSQVFEGLEGATEADFRAYAGQLMIELFHAHQIIDDQATKLTHKDDEISEAQKRARTLTEIASHDDLTGLPNRSALRTVLEEVLNTERPTSVIMFDLDGFKELNDTLGHPEGDRALKLVAERLHTILRPGDEAFRLGGDEFIVVIDEYLHEDDIAEEHPFEPVKAASSAAERIETDLADAFKQDEAFMRIKGAGASAASLRIESGMDRNFILEEVDSRMYARKEQRQAGR